MRLGASRENAVSIVGIVVAAGFAACHPGSTLGDAAADAAVALKTAIKTDYPTGKTPAFVALGDLNGDGMPDLAIANNADGTVSVLLNQGGGKLAAKVDYPTGPQPNWIAIADIDGDGKPDLVVADDGPAAETVSVLLNQGNGTFGVKIDSPTGPAGKNRNASSVAVADFNGDGKLDIAVVNEGTDGNFLDVLLNQGGGPGAATFAPPVDYATGKDPAVVTAGDVDGDGKPDLVVGNYSADSISVYTNPQGTGVFQPQVNYSVGNPLSIVITDLDGDGKPDLAIADWVQQVAILGNKGSGTFGVASYYQIGDYSSPISVAVADFDGDKKPDIAFASPDTAAFGFLFNQGATGFSAPVSYQAETPFGLAAGDLDGDGKPDLALLDHISNSVSVILNAANSF